MIFEAYSDESGTFDHRYQSIAIVSGSKDVLEHLRNGLQKNLGANRIREVRFYEIKGYGRRKAISARYFINHAVNHFARIHQIRIDVITWDTCDSRHNIEERDDIANLGIMYYNLIIHIARQWGQNQWDFHPDVNSQIDWGKIAKYASLKSLFNLKYHSPTLIELDTEESFVRFGEIKEVDSIKEPLVQLADLFAGMGRFSREEGGRCIEFLTWGDKNQYKLPIEDDIRCEIKKEKGSKYQPIPRSLVPIFALGTEPMKGWKLQYILKSMCKKAEIELPEEAGWHAIRRRVVTAIYERTDAKDLPIINFFRWSTKQRHLSQLPTYVHSDTEESDRRILAQHPFVPMWEGIVPYLMEYHPEYSQSTLARQLYNEIIPYNRYRA